MYTLCQVNLMPLESQPIFHGQGRKSFKEWKSLLKNETSMLHVKTERIFYPTWHSSTGNGCPISASDTMETVISAGNFQELKSWIESQGISKRRTSQPVCLFWPKLLHMDADKIMTCCASSSSCSPSKYVSGPCSRIPQSYSVQIEW